MPTLSKRVATGLVAAMSLHALPATARDPQSPTQLERWTEEAQASLRRALVEPRPIGRRSEPAGVADVSFVIGADGRATRVSILHPSGLRSVDGVAMAAVRRIRTRSAAPPELAAGRTIVARIFIAPGDRPLDGDGMRAMVSRTAARNAWADRDRLAGESRSGLVLAARR